MLLSAVSVLVVAQSSSEIPEGLMNNPVHDLLCRRLHVFTLMWSSSGLLETSCQNAAYIVGIPRMYAAFWRLASRRPDDDHIRVETCSLLNNKWCVLTYWILLSLYVNKWNKKYQTSSRLPTEKVMFIHVVRKVPAFATAFHWTLSWYSVQSYRSEGNTLTETRYSVPALSWITSVISQRLLESCG